MRFSKIICMFIVFLILAAGSIQAADQQKVKSLRIDGNLTFDLLAHKLQPGWSIYSSNLAKLYTHDLISKDKWHYVGGQTLNLDLSYRPSKNWTMMLGILAIGSYADRFYIPINDEHRLKHDGQKIKWTRGELAYKGDRFQASLNGGIGHYHWENEGDMFQLYPEQFDVYNYRRISGRQTPRGLDLKYAGDFGKLELVHGAELVWGDHTSTYGKYNWRWGYFNNAFIFKNARISWGEKPKEHLNAYELSTKIDMIEWVPIDLGVLYQPFRLGREFLYVEESGSNNLYTIPNSTATINTGSRLIKSGTTSTSDAIGYKTKVGFRFIPGIEEVSVGYAHLGASAGNKQEYSGGLKKEINAFSNLDFTGIYQKPIYGPLPYLFEGAASDPGTGVLRPRARTDAFWVTMENRQAHIYKLTLNFDPTPSSWLYLWQPNIIEEWNMNPKEDATIAMAFQYLARQYPTATDRWFYRTRDDDILWEGESDATKEFWDYRPWGKWPTGWLHNFNTMIRLIPAPTYKFWVNLKWGQDVATSALAYTNDTDENKPITNYFLGTIWLDKKPYKASATIGRDVWGWEEWQQRFGGTNDRLYKFSLSRTWESAPFESTDSTFGVEYVGIREKDNQYVYPELGSFDEWRLFFNLHFGSLVVFQEEEKSIVVEEGPARPIASLTVLTPVFTPGTGDNPEAVFALAASDNKGLKSWEISILDMNDNLVQILSGKGQPPLEKEWDGTDLASKETAPEGDYKVIFKVINKANKSAKTDPQAVTLQIPQIEIAKEVLAEAPVEIREEERGLVMNITSAVLFDFDKSKLKAEALQLLPDVVKLLAMYPDNKILVEGYTDSIGPEEYNQKLSTRRANSVYNYFAEQGIEKERMEKKGYGETKPVASNRTNAGRTLNRRVEIILLKEPEEEITGQPMVEPE
ncbi:MAG: OmpA family protein [bacterium]|nr:OmpA family protein [bacterium]MDD5353561.1 OmpA family protein [bacterium]MDD5756839.1 OmpA family protein [bacterium]